MIHCDMDSYLDPADFWMIILCMSIQIDVEDGAGMCNYIPKFYADIIKSNIKCEMKSNCTFPNFSGYTVGYFGMDK